MEKKEMTFEASMERLEEVLRLLENGNESLDASLALYEEGITLIRACNEKLEKAEHEVEEIIKSATVRAERMGDEIIAEANAKADAAIKKADADIAQSKKKAINEIKNDIAGISVSIAEKVVEREINEKDHNDIIESFIDQL